MDRDRKEALEQFIKCKEMGYLKSFVPTIPAMEKAIAALQEPERKKGHWIEIIKDERFGDEWDEIAVYKCSVCESEFVECMGTYNFCPNCGADMRGEQE